MVKAEAWEYNGRHNKACVKGVKGHLVRTCGVAYGGMVAGGGGVVKGELSGEGAPHHHGSKCITKCSANARNKWQ